MKPFVASGFFQGEDPNTRSKKKPSKVRHWTRVTQIVFDTQDPNLVWAGVEIDGAWRSRDAGKTWTRTSEGLEHDDVHGLAVIHNGGRRLFATTAGGLHLSCDAGSTWTVQPIDLPWQYVRSVVPKTRRQRHDISDKRQRPTRKRREVVSKSRFRQDVAAGGTARPGGKLRIFPGRTPG